MRLCLIRHGETQANVDGLYSGHAPTPLTARGIEQAQNLHTLLHDVSFDLVLCSELERAQHTARLVLSDRQHPVHIIPELNEMFFGDWEMRHHRDLMQEDAENYNADLGQKVCIVSQTTFNYNKFQELVEIITKKGYDIIVLNTICNATEERQAEAAGIAAQVDAMIVVGGKSSSNTQKLFEICKKECKNTYYIQTVKDLDLDFIRSVDDVGITAGASTPNKIIEEVQKNVRNEL